MMDVRWNEELDFVPRSSCSVATAMIGSSVIGGAASIFGSQSAAKAQQASAQQATNAQMAMFQQSQQNLQPFITGGQNIYGQLQSALPGLTAAFQPTMQQLAQTPGYQFTLGQGLQATQNSFAAQGLGSSGAAMKGAANYAEGLAGTTYQQQFQNNLAQNAQAYNMLYGGSALGANAAAGLASQATNVGGQIGSNILGAGNAQAAANVATGNAFGSAFGSIPSAMMYNQLYASGAFGTNTAGSYGYGG